MTTKNNIQPGRPRDETHHAAITNAARELVRQYGYKGMSISAIVKKAGVSRQTLYRRWPTKADLVLDAFIETAGPALDLDEIPQAPGSTRHALKNFLLGVFERLNTDGISIRNLIASAQDDPDFQNHFRDRFVVPRDRLVAHLLAHAVAQGELPPHTDIETLTTMVHGAFWYRLLNNQDLDEAFAEALVKIVFRH